MKRLLTLFVVLLAFLAATAQVEHSIILDQSTFRPVQDDPLSGVNIDPIAKDASRNACARVKIKFANMSRAEVDALAVKFLSNTDLVRQYVAEYFDNVLILEMTAKPNTRFYVVSPDFGESNEVCLNLEGNKVYQMMARLNQLYSIVVSSNMPDVEVYLDDCYQGNTDKNNQLSIHDVIPGSHRLKLKIGNDVAEQNIVVHRGSIAFKVDINLAAPTQSYSIVVMSNMPDVEVFVDGNYKGITDSNNQLSIPDVASGTHQLKLKFGATTAEQTIAVHRNSIFFKQDLQLSQSDSSSPSNLGDIEMVYVKGGTFTMGATAEQRSDADDDEKPTHSVTLSDYYIGKYEVTQAQWRAIMGSNPSHFTGDNNPVEQVSWEDVQKFIKKLNKKTGKKFRLPTEAEWEYAARGGNKSKGYKYSGSNNISEVAWYDDISSNMHTHPVGQKSPNELGIYDMSGNVYEWCQDWSGSYSSSSQTNPTGPSSGYSRVLRSGEWSLLAEFCRVSDRNHGHPGTRSDLYGFRLACSAE